MFTTNVVLIYFTRKYEEKGFCYKCGLVLHGNMKRFLLQMWSFTLKNYEKGFYYKCDLVLHGNMKKRVFTANVILFYMEM